MDDVIRNRIEAVRAEVHRSEMEPELKDALQVRLDHATRCANGHPDKINAIAEAVSDGIVHDVRNEVRIRERINASITAAVAAHAIACPLNKGAPKTWKEFTSTMIQQYPTAVLVAFLWLVQRFGLEPVLEFLKGAAATVASAP